MKNKKKFTFLLLFILFNVLLLLLLREVALKIRNSKSTTIHINRKNQIYVSRDLKYFYEPNPDALGDLYSDFNYLFKISINADSLNERKNYSVEKPINVYRIITLGDSFTFGIGVTTAKNYSEQLEDLLNQRLACTDIDAFEVINLGVYGYDIEYALQRYKIRGTKYKPDMLFWLINDWDLTKRNEKIQEMMENQKLFRGETPDVKSKKVIEKFNSENPNHAVATYQIKQVNENREIFPSPVIIAGFFGREFVKNYFTPPVSEYNFIYYNDLPDIWKTGDIIPEDGHPNEQGHRKIAENVFAYLHQNFFSSCISK